MVRTVTLFLGVLAAALPASTIRIQAQGNNPFVGTWKLISIETRTVDGSIAAGPNPVGGLNPSGTVMYDAAGHVSLQIMPSGRPASLNILQPISPDQAREALFGYIAYYGTYTIDPGTRVMHIHFDGSLNPSMVGTDGERYYEFDGNRMKFQAGANTTLFWERVR